MWLTIDTVAKLLNVSPRLVCYRLAEFAIKKEPGKKGKSKTFIHLSSLPEEYQIKYLSSSANHKTENIVGWEKLSDMQRETAISRHQVVKQAIEIQETSKTVTDDISALAEKSGISTKTLYDWVSWYSKGKLDTSTGEQMIGLMALAPQYGKTRGRFLSMPKEMQDFVRGQWLQPNRPSIELVYLNLQQWAKQSGLEAPCRNTVHSFVRTIPEAANKLLRVGKFDYSSAHEPVMHRTSQELAFNEIWVGDHREHDVFIYVSEQNRQQAKRVWMTAWWDLASAKLVGCTFSFAPNSRTIANALRNGIITYGVPNMVYIDNGKDYRSHLLNGTAKNIGPVDFDHEAKGVLAALNIGVTHAIPRNARSKQIERWFRMWSEQFDTQLPGWCGRNNKIRPEKLAQEIKDGKLLTMSEFRGMAEQFIEKLDNTAYGDREKTPQQYVEEAQVVKVNVDVLNALLLERAKIKVTNYGIMMFGGLCYRNDELMRNVLVGQYVRARYNPDDLSSIVVWTMEGRLIGRVPLQTPVSAGELNVEAMKEVQNYRKSQRQIINGLVPVNMDFQNDFQKALEEVMKRRETRDRDKIIDEKRGPETNIRMIFANDTAKLVSDVSKAKEQKNDQEENVVPLFFKDAGNADFVTPKPVEPRNPLSESEE